MSVDATFSILREGLEGRSIAATLKTYIGTLTVVAILALLVGISVGVENLFRLTPLMVAGVVVAEYCISAASHGYLKLLKDKAQESKRQAVLKDTLFETKDESLPNPAPTLPSDSGQFLADLAGEIDHLDFGVETTTEDLETHYNLGIAFREMGLLEEAISEFQKVADATEHREPFRYTMQCFALLGLAFMEKGQPGIAASWYERALYTPGIDPESALALRYDLGVAQESAGELEQALHTLSTLHEMEKEYRDVAQRVRALEKIISH